MDLWYSAATRQRACCRICSWIHLHGDLKHCLPIHLTKLPVRFLGDGSFVRNVDCGTGVFDARSSRTLEVSSLLHRLLPLLGGFPSLSVSFLWQETSAPSPSWFPSPLFAPRDTLDF